MKQRLLAASYRPILSYRIRRVGLRWRWFTRHKCKPKLNNLNHSKISQLYADLRKESMAGGMPIAVRVPTGLGWRTDTTDCR